MKVIEDPFLSDEAADFSEVVVPGNVYAEDLTLVGVGHCDVGRTAIARIGVNVSNYRAIRVVGAACVVGVFHRVVGEVNVGEVAGEFTRWLFDEEAGVKSVLEVWDIVFFDEVMEDVTGFGVAFVEDSEDDEIVVFVAGREDVLGFDLEAINEDRESGFISVEGAESVRDSEDVAFA
jgi:hypothetical protein